MAGFRDLLSVVIGWMSAAPGTQAPFRTAAGEVWHTGTSAAGIRVTGPMVGRVNTFGKIAGQTHG